VREAFRARVARTTLALVSGLWAGGLLALGAVAAPTLFRTLQAPALAGRTFGAVLGVFDRVETGFAAAALLACAAWVAGPPRSRRMWTALLLVLFMTLTTGLTAFAIHPAVVRERNSVAGFDGLPSGHPSKARFDALHRASVRASSAKLVSAFLLLGICAWGPRPGDPDGS
jgi:hypothetical protein